MGNALANARQSFAKISHSIVLRFIANLAPLRMIAILLSSFLITPCGLNVTTRIWANPYILPGWRNAYRTNTLQLFFIMDGLSISTDITEMLSSSLAPYSRHCVTYVT